MSPRPWVNVRKRLEPSHWKMSRPVLATSRSWATSWCAQLVQAPSPTRTTSLSRWSRPPPLQSLIKLKRRQILMSKLSTSFLVKQNKQHLMPPVTFQAPRWWGTWVIIVCNWQGTCWPSRNQACSVSALICQKSPLCKTSPWSNAATLNNQLLRSFARTSWASRRYLRAAFIPLEQKISRMQWQWPLIKYSSLMASIRSPRCQLGTMCLLPSTLTTLERSPATTLLLKFTSRSFLRRCQALLHHQLKTITKEQKHNRPNSQRYHRCLK